MRLFTKIFLFGMLVFGLAFSGSGYFLLRYSLESSLARETDFALRQYQYDKFTVQSVMLTYSDVTLVFSVKDGLDGLSPETAGRFTLWQVFPETDGPAGTEDLSAAEASPNVQVSDKEAGSQEGDEVLSLEKEFLQDEIMENFFGHLADEISVPVAFYGEDQSPLFTEIEGLEPSFLGGLSEDAHVYQLCSTPGGGCVLVGSMLGCGGRKVWEPYWGKRRFISSPSGISARPWPSRKPCGSIF